MRTRIASLAGALLVVGCSPGTSADELAVEACESLEQQGDDADLSEIEERRQEADVPHADLQREMRERCPELSPFEPDPEGDLDDGTADDGDSDG